MKSLLVLLFLTACAIAHNGDRIPRNPHARRARNGPRSPIKDELVKLMKPDPRTSMNFLVPKYVLDVQERNRIPYVPLKAEFTMLNEEIKRIEQLPEKSDIPYKPESETQHSRHPNVDHKDPAKPSPSNIINIKGGGVRKPPIISGKILKVSDLLHSRSYDQEDKKKERTIFAFTPMDREFFSPTETSYPHTSMTNSFKTTFDRDLRQNPNLSRDKTLATSKLEELERVLNSDSVESTAETQGVFGFNRDTVYLVLLSASLAAAVIVPTLIIVYGIYMLMKRSKTGAADYPSYGVTGPSVDSFGDQSLAHSAQMYHYHHQKQQIIAMERGTIEQHNGSLSDPESEENEEGDYTVYECPGFATTGVMEVKNPLFDEPTPATPGKVQVVQTQLKE